MSLRAIMRHCVGPAVAVVFGGCSASVQNVYGTYVATYPFGTDTITLNRDGTLDQQVVITGDPPPEIAHGHWSFDPSNGYVTFDVYLQVDNGFGKLNRTWRTPHHGLAASLPIEKILFRMTMGSGAQYPYVKQ
jgi:hypothetical protein